MREHLGSELDQFIQLYLGRSLQRRPLRGRELKGTHAANADITKPLNRVEALRPPPLSGEPRIDQCVAEFIGQ